MPAFKDLGLGDREIAAIVQHLRSLVRDETERVASSLPKVESLPPGDAARGGALYARHCAGCHGPNATDGRAPALRNPGFLQAADDLYIARTILTGRTGTAMRHFGRPTPEFPVLDWQEVTDIIAFLHQAPASPGEKR